MIKSVYIAAPWVYKEKAKLTRDLVEEVGIKVIARWIDFPGDSHDPEVLRAEANHDWQDVNNSEGLLLLNYQKRGAETSGHAVETGLALAKGHPVFMVGEPSNVFHHLDEVEKYDTVEGAIKAMRAY